MMTSFFYHIVSDARILPGSIGLAKHQINWIYSSSNSIINTDRFVEVDIHDVDPVSRIPIGRMDVVLDIPKDLESSKEMKHIAQKIYKLRQNSKMMQDIREQCLKNRRGGCLSKIAMRDYFMGRRQSVRINTIPPVMPGEVAAYLAKHVKAQFYEVFNDHVFKVEQKFVMEFDGIIFDGKVRYIRNRIRDRPGFLTLSTSVIIEFKMQGGETTCHPDLLVDITPDDQETRFANANELT